MTKRIFAIFIAIGLISGMFFNVSYAETDGINCSMSVSNNEPVIIDEKPGIDVKITIPNNSSDRYEVRLTTDYDKEETVLIENTGAEQNLHFEFAVNTEGYHHLKAELLINGLIYDEIQFEQHYVRSISNASYNERGFSVHWEQGKGSDLDADMLVASGVPIVRDGISWTAVEKEKGVYDWSKHDKYIDTLTQKGIEIYMVVDSYAKSHPLYPDENGNTLIKNDDQIEAFSDFVLAAAKRYPEIRKWEILNESNFVITGEEYFNIAYKTAKKLKEYDPTLEIYVGALAQKNQEEFVSGFYLEKLYPYVDYISTHYYNHWRYADVPAYLEEMDKITAIMEKEGGWHGLSMSEIGYATGTSTEQVPEIKQASENVKRAVLGDMYGMDFFVFYDFKNDGYDMTEREHTFGAITIENEPKPFYYTNKQYHDATNKAQYIGEAYISDDIASHIYASGEDLFMIAWAKNSNPKLGIVPENNVTASFTFPEGVLIENMFGEHQPTNVLTATYQPSYIFGLGKEFCFDALYNNSSVDIFSDLKTILANHGYGVADLEAKYSAIRTNMDYPSVAAYVNACYDFAEALTKDFLEDDLKMSEKGFSNLLSEIAKVAKKGASYGALLDDAEKSVNEDLAYEYDSFIATPAEAAKKDVAYMNEPYYMGRKLISKCEEYDEGQRVMPVVGNGFSLKSDNTMYFSGASEKDEVFIRIENQSGEEVYLNILPTDGNGNYYFEYTPDMPFGDYTVYVNDGSIKETAFAYKEATDYVSFEDKMTAVNLLQAERLLGLYESMLGWADIKYEYNNPDIKALTWTNTKSVIVSGRVERLSWADSNSIFLTVKGKTSGEVLYTATTVCDDLGYYKFTFDYNGNLNDIVAEVNQGGVVKENIECRIAKENELILGSFEIEDDSDAKKILLHLRNYFKLSGKNVQVAVVCYDKDGRMQSCDLKDIREIPTEDSTLEYSLGNFESVSVKVFAWDSVDGMKPYVPSVTVE